MLLWLRIIFKTNIADFSIHVGLHTNQTPPLPPSTTRAPPCGPVLTHQPAHFNKCERCLLEVGDRQVERWVECEQQQKKVNFFLEFGFSLAWTCFTFTQKEKKKLWEKKSSTAGEIQICDSQEWLSGEVIDYWCVEWGKAVWSKVQLSAVGRNQNKIKKKKKKVRNKWNIQHS